MLRFTLAGASLATLLFGLAPMVSAMRISPTLATKSGNASVGTDRNRLLGRRLAVSAQTAVCVVLLVAAALMVRTLRRYQTEDLGISTQEPLVFGVTLTGMQSNKTVQFYRDLLDKLRVLLREFAGRGSQPTAMIVDSRTIQSTPESGDRAGYDGAKRRKGSKVHAAVDTLEHLLALHVKFAWRLVTHSITRTLQIRMETSVLALQCLAPSTQ